MYVKGTKLIQYLKETKQKDEAFTIALTEEFMKQGLVIKADVADPKKKFLRTSLRNPKVFEPECFYVWTFEGSAGGLFIYICIFFF